MADPVVHIPLTPWAINLSLWAQRETARWRYFRIYFETRGKYPRFFWTPVVRRKRRFV